MYNIFNKEFPILTDFYLIYNFFSRFLTYELMKSLKFANKMTWNECENLLLHNIWIKLDYIKFILLKTDRRYGKLSIFYSTSLYCLNSSLHLLHLSEDTVSRIQFTICAPFSNYHQKKQIVKAKSWNNSIQVIYLQFWRI
jgi:hypothetical protein